MTKETKDSIDEMIDVLVYQADQAQSLIDTLEPGSQERSRQVSDVLKIMEHVEAVYNKEYETNLKYEEIRKKYRAETAKTAIAGVTAATGVAGLYVWWKAYVKGIHFEQTGSFSSSITKGVLGMMSRLPGIKF